MTDERINANDNKYGIEKVYGGRGLGIDLPFYPRDCPLGKVAVKYNQGSDPIEHLKEVVPGLFGWPPKDSIIYLEPWGKVNLWGDGTDSNKEQLIGNEIEKIKIKEMKRKGEYNEEGTIAGVKIPWSGILADHVAIEPALEYFQKGDYFQIKLKQDGEVISEIFKVSGENEETYSTQKKSANIWVGAKGRFKLKNISPGFLERICFKDLGGIEMDLKENKLTLPLWQKDKGYLPMNVLLARKMIKDSNIWEEKEIPSLSGGITISNYS